MTRLPMPCRWPARLAGLCLAGCAAGPAPPAWQAEARQAVLDAQVAWLDGDTAAEARAFERARHEIARTGQPGLMARAELARCAAHVASLDFTPCAGYEALQADAPAAERAYAAYLAGRATPAEQALLPEPQRALAAAARDADAAQAALQAQPDALSRLLGAALLLQAGRASPATVALAVDTASAQGWRRPLVAWLNVQFEHARHAGRTEEAARIRRRIDLVLGGTPQAAP